MQLKWQKRITENTLSFEKLVCVLFCFGVTPQVLRTYSWRCLGDHLGWWVGPLQGKCFTFVLSLWLWDWSWPLVTNIFHNQALIHACSVPALYFSPFSRVQNSRRTRRLCDRANTKHSFCIKTWIYVRWGLHVCYASLSLWNTLRVWWGLTHSSGCSAQSHCEILSPHQICLWCHWVGWKHLHHGNGQRQLQGYFAIPRTHGLLHHQEKKSEIQWDFPSRKKQKQCWLGWKPLFSKANARWLQCSGWYQRASGEECVWLSGHPQRALSSDSLVPPAGSCWEPDPAFPFQPASQWFPKNIVWLLCHLRQP